MSAYKVLLIDNDQDFLEGLQGMLQPLGYQLFAAKNLEQAQEYLKVHHPNTILILSDYELDGETGFDVRAATKTEYPQIPFVLMSGVIDKDMALKGIDEKISGFLAKPFSLEELKALMDRDCKSVIDDIDEELDLIDGFLDDTKPLMEEIESNILTIEESKGDQGAIDNLMRLLHTIKGTAACVGLEDLSHLAHKYEDLVTSTKSGEHEVDTDLTNVFLQGFDLLKRELSTCPKRTILSEEEKEKQVEIFKIKPKREKSAEDKKAGSTEASKIKQNASDVVAQKVNAINSLNSDKKEEISVAVTTLDYFMELSGELTVSRNASNKLLQKLENVVGNSDELDNLTESLNEIHKICGAMQNLVVETRKVSLKHVFKTVPRVVRDLGKSTNKKIEFKIIGDEIRVDNSLAKVLSNSIVHMVRNSIDHGLETPDERTANQKNEMGTLSIRCRDEGEEIIVELVDDGRGINRERIKSRVLEKELYSAQEVEEMSDKRILSMIFEPGFSTAEVITDVSGRGVGMDMVRTSVLGVNGRIDIESEPNKGTKISLVLPKPKAVLIMSSLFVSLGGEKFAIPQTEIQRVIQLEEESRQSIQKINDNRFLKIDGEILPIIELADKLKLKNADFERQNQVSRIVVLQSEQCRFAIEVDEVLDVEEVVVKKIENKLAQVDVFLGVTYGEDGELCLTLNPETIGRCYISEKLEDLNDQIEEVESENRSEEYSQMLLLKINAPGQYAIPLRSVYRLEQFSRSEIQIAQNKEIINYNGVPMYLFDLRELIGLEKQQDQPPMDPMHVVVARISGIFFGFVVDDILDIVNSNSEIESHIADRDCLMGGFEHQGKTVTLVDIYLLMSGLGIESSKNVDPEIAAA